jgi:predicted kinase
MAEKSSYPNSDNVSVITLKVDAVRRRHSVKQHTSNSKNQDGSEDSLQSAIEQLQQVMAEYEDEFNSKS